MSIRILILPAAILLAMGVHAAEPATTTANGPHAQTLAQARSQISNNVAAMDLNRDGFIDAEELKAAHEQRKAERQQRRAEAAQKRFAALDTDGDGKVSVAEVTAARTARLEAMDADGDGVISREEMRQGRRGIRGKHRGAGMHADPAMHDGHMH